MSSAPKKIFIPTEKQKQAADPAHSVWVSANAGSGKTQVLVQRVIRILLEGIEPASILCITYTKAAAAEMADRLFGQLASWTALPDAELAEVISNLGADGKDKSVLTRARKLFTLALETPGGLKIQTIHAFCERLLHLFPVEAGLSPGFGLLDDRAGDELREKVIADVVYGAEKNHVIAEAFDRLNNRLNREQFGQLVTDYIAGLRKSAIDLNAVTPALYAAKLKLQIGLPIGEDAGTLRHLFCAIDRSAYAKHAAALKSYKPHYGLNLAAALLAVSKADDPYEALLKVYFTGELQFRKQAVMAAMTVKEQPEAAAFIESEITRIQPLWLRLKSLELIEANADVFTIASAILLEIENEKQRTGKVDFQDLIQRAAQLLATSQARDWVTFKLDPGLSHILLDESQDTGPAQWIIINRLVEEFFAGKGAQEVQQGKRTLFVVGDEKQSIYSFQGADAEAFAEARNHYLATGHFENVPLDISYRSTDEILLAVDRVRSGKPIEDATLRSHTAHRQDDKGIVEIWPLIMPDANPELEPWAKPVDQPPQSSPRRILARTLASTLKLWFDPQAPRKLAGKNRAVTAGDILILFRSRGPLFRMVMAELRAASILVAGADRLSLLQSLIVQDFMALLNWLLLPQDDYSLACVLKSPLVPDPLSEEQLFEAAHARTATLFEHLTGTNLFWLRELQQLSSRIPPDVLLAHILGRCRKEIAARLGPEALEASDAMLDMALDYQREGAASLFGFVQWFGATETTLKREMDKASGEVRLMTVHGAKGLEAPVVIIADAAQAAVGNNTRPAVLDFNFEPGRTLPIWYYAGADPLLPPLDGLKDAAKDLQLQESDRLLYVAMTRAEDELYIGGAGRKSKTGFAPDSWWAKLIHTLGAPQGDTPLRFGPEDIHLPPAVALAPGERFVPPPWLQVSRPAEFEAQPLGLNAALTGTRTYDAKAARLGRARHLLLQGMADLPAAERLNFALSRTQRLRLPEHEVLPLVQSLALPVLQPFLGPGSRAEVDIRGYLRDGRLVRGRLDRLAERPEGLWLLDYKTGSVASLDHLKQMAGYVELLRAAYPGKAITAALFFTQSQQLDILSPQRLTAALQESDAALP